MFTIPAVLSIGLDASVVILYLRNSALFDAEWKRPTQELFDLSLCSFDVVRMIEALFDQHRLLQELTRLDYCKRMGHDRSGA